MYKRNLLALKEEQGVSVALYETINSNLSFINRGMQNI